MPQTSQKNTFIISVSVGQESGCGLPGPFTKDLTRLELRCQLGLQSPLWVKIVFQVYVLVGRIQFLVVIEEIPSSLPCGPLYFMAVCFFKARRRACLLQVAELESYIV